LAVVVGELDDGVDRRAWAEALGEEAGALTVVAGATRAYQKNLPLVGKAVVRLLTRVAGLPPPNP